MKGIMFKEELFQAVVNGQKTQTRRVIKGVNPNEHFISISDGLWAFNLPGFSGDTLVKPRYKREEIVYMKEPYCTYGTMDSNNQPIGGAMYKFDGNGLPDFAEKWENKMFMPAKYARYFIRITGVRCEKLKEITRSDIRAEGLMCPQELKSDDKEYNYRHWYIDEWKRLWDSINKPPFSWQDNPWVWVYEFQLTKKPVHL